MASPSTTSRDATGSSKNAGENLTAGDEESSSSSFRTMPAEWSPHLSCLILYPHNPSVFRSPSCEPARKQVRQVARTIAQDGQEDVILFCNTQEDAQILRQEIQENDDDDENNKNKRNIHVLVCPSNDSWARDTGPTFVIGDKKNRKTLAGLDWDFNAYGGPEHGCYWPCDLDQAVASNMCQALSSQYDSTIIEMIDCLKIPLVLEGGSIHTDGEGTVLTTRECLLHPNRNPNLSQEEIERAVLQALGCTKVIWLPHGLAADVDTNGHIDNMACFVRPTHVALSWCDDKAIDPDNYRRCREDLAVLQKETDAKGRSLTIHKLHLPPPMYYTEEEVRTLASDSGRKVGERLAASYVNFYIANRAVVVPQFGHEKYDALAIQSLQQFFQDRKVVGVPSREILVGGGNIHCITQQVPLLQK